MDGISKKTPYGRIIRFFRMRHKNGSIYEHSLHATKGWRTVRIY